MRPEDCGIVGVDSATAHVPRPLWLPPSRRVWTSLLAGNCFPLGFAVKILWRGRFTLQGKVVFPQKRQCFSKRDTGISSIKNTQPKVKMWIRSNRIPREFECGGEAG
ncbi:hypothetical protein VULLAG_LOCUS9256 [Vulpes lagopus]